jgi:cell division protein FtsL
VKTSLPVGEVEPWAGLQVAPEVGAAPEVIGRYAACVGALAAEHARRCGREAAGPLIRGGKPARRARAASDFVRLAVLNVLLLAAFVVSAFAVRSARLHAVTVAMERARPLLAELAPLEEEVRILQAESELLAPKIDLMLAIARALPPGMEVAELRIDRKGHVVIRGTTPSVEAVSKAVAALEAGGELADPRFQRVEPAKQGKTFQIECTVR